MNWFEIIGLISLCFALTGSILNNRKMIICFLPWIVSNVIYFGMHIHLSAWSLALKDVVFFGICIEGYLRWKKLKKVGK